jgi:hypothetical protein
MDGFFIPGEGFSKEDLFQGLKKGFAEGVRRNRFSVALDFAASLLSGLGSFELDVIHSNRQKFVSRCLDLADEFIAQHMARELPELAGSEEFLQGMFGLMFGQQPQTPDDEFPSELFVETTETEQPNDDGNELPEGAVVQSGGPDVVRTDGGECPGVSSVGPDAGQPTSTDDSSGV